MNKGIITTKNKSLILLIDDLRTDRLKIKTYLAENYEVISACDGQQGLGLAQSKQPDLILLDMFLPDIDGFFVLQALRKHPLTELIPVIMLSSYFEEEEHIVQALELGANDYLIKPVNEKILAVKVSQEIRMFRAERALQDALAQRERLLQTIQSAIIGVDSEDQVNYWNDAAANYFGLDSKEVMYQPILRIGIVWQWDVIVTHILACLENRTHSERFEISLESQLLGQRLVSVGIAVFLTEDNLPNGYMILIDDITEQAVAAKQVQHAEKMQSIGQLAAGIAHEINTPMQYIGDNTCFLQEAFADLNTIIGSAQKLSDSLTTDQQSRPYLEETDAFDRNTSAPNHVLSPVVSECRQAFESQVEEMDLEYLSDEVPKAIEQALEGIDRVSTIVRAMQDFSHPGTDRKEFTDINRAIQSTVTVARNVWKYVADMDLELDEELPEIPCLVGALNEVILNLTVNAAHAIADFNAAHGLDKGKITIKTCSDQEWAEIQIKDTGGGIPSAIHDKVFDPFFTTKEVGKGTGQGLALSYSIITKKHSGELFFDSQEGIGTCFFIRLPMDLNNEVT